MSLRLELGAGAVLQATTLKTFVRGPGVNRFLPRLDGGPRQSSRGRGQPCIRQNEGTACDLRSFTWQALSLRLTFEVSIGTTCRPQ